MTTTTTPRRSLATDRDNVSTQPHAGGFGLPRIVTTVPMNIFNSINPFAAADQSKSDMKEHETGAQQSNLLFKRPALISLLGGRTQSTGSKGEIQGKKGVEDEHNPHLRQRSTTVMFAEPELTDSDNASRDGSVTDEIRRQRKKNRQKTTFSICHPPPASLTRHKLHRRPRSLLQLHRLTPNSRPVPAYEVIPSANFSVRLVKSITKVYKAKHGLCINDFVILRAEKYYTQDHEEEQAEQDIVALICRGRANDGAGNNKAKICMANGEDWEAYHLNSGYEFFTTDDHGLAITVRWVPKRSKEGRPEKQKRFQFSTIAQNTRKHPVIASLTSVGLDINDTYKIPDPAVSTPLSTPKNSEGFLSQAMENDEDLRGQDDCVTDERLRSIISVTAIWVAFQEGWSPYYKNEDKDVNGSLKASSPRKDGLDSPSDTPPGSPAQYALDKRGSIRSVGSDIMRRSSLLSSRALRSNRNSTLSVDSITSNDTATDVSAQSPTTKHNRARSDSASTVLVHRAASNRRRNNKQATWRPDLLDAQHTVPEASREDLSRVPSRHKSKRMSTIDSLGSPASKKSAISPLRAPDNEESDDSGSAHSQAERDKRESSATENTSSSEHGEGSKKKRKSIQQKSASPAAKKTGGWKKLLCIR